MINECELFDRELIFKTSSASQAKLIRSIIVGQNSELTLSPYGNRISVALEDGQAILVKESGNPFTYEEIRTVVKKLLMFHRIKPGAADHALNMSRMKLNSKLTLFYPNKNMPRVEISFSYNWASISFHSDKFNDLYPEIRDAILEGQSSAIKVFSNNIDTISIHNYAMQGIYVSRRAFEGIAAILIKSNILNPSDKDSFALRATAFGVLSVSYMEARQICKNTDETFSIDSEEDYNPLIGNRKFLSPTMNLLQHLTEKGQFSGAPEEGLRLLHNVWNDSKAIEKHSLAITIRGAVSAFVRNYHEEVEVAYARLKAH